MVQSSAGFSPLRPATLHVPDDLAQHHILALQRLDLLLQLCNLRIHYMHKVNDTWQTSTYTALVIDNSSQDIMTQLLSSRFFSQGVMERKAHQLV